MSTIQRLVEGEKFIVEGQERLSFGIKILRSAGRKISIVDFLPEEIRIEERRAAKSIVTQVFDAVADEILSIDRPDSYPFLEMVVEKIRKLQSNAEKDERFIGWEFRPVKD